MSNGGNYFLTWLGLIIGLIVISIPAIILVIIWLFLRYLGLSSGWIFLVMIILTLLIAWAIFAQAKKFSNMLNENRTYIDELMQRYNLKA